MEKIYYKCKECGSTDILFSCVACKWDYDKQDWIYWDGEGGHFMCQNFDCLNTYSIVEINELAVEEGA